MPLPPGKLGVFRLLISLEPGISHSGRQNVPKVVVVAQVEDSVKWEEGFRTHGDLFRSQTITKPINFGTIEGNQIAVCVEPDDLTVFMKIMDSPATAEALMALDERQSRCSSWTRSSKSSAKPARPTPEHSERG